jgi:hypothetical protein
MPVKNTSRIACAFWNESRYAERPAALPSTPRLKVHGLTEVSTCEARFFWKKSSIIPPGANSCAKSPLATSRGEPRVNG